MRVSLVATALLFLLPIVRSQSDNRIECIENIRRSYPWMILNEIDKSQQIIAISYTATGCDLHDYYRHLLIQKDGENYLTSLCNYSRKLNQESLLTLLDSFYYSLKFIDPNGGCTTQEKIMIEINDTSYIGFNGDCKWRGFSNLIMSLFGVYPHEICSKM